MGLIPIWFRFQLVPASLAVGLFAGCGSKASTTDDDAGADNPVGTTDAGAPDVAPRNPSLPPPPDDGCERYGITLRSCTGQCPAWPCDKPAYLPPANQANWCQIGDK